MLEEVESSRGSTTNADGNVVATILKTLDANKYATKKTIAQGLLDVALLTANASQLKYILQVGEKHEFYTLMLTLIIISIVLQVAVGVLCLTLNLLRDCRLHIEDYHSSAQWLNYFTTTCAFFITVLNLLISCFDPTIAKYAIFEAPSVDGSL
ncbi:PREDICTED: ninjurin-2-like isoform X2 [Nicrophorus vespilloides]|uniref:Ninjurin-2-like isoform X2 n=1 Tax=Nicrophorus vespilloides TaxID=110193 RepID=A0ABM1MYI6_NICVS|nr:PREDICTED: ninjurin-2-like isoform X2 [Nicrophorus vespilloides]